MSENTVVSGVVSNGSDRMKRAWETRRLKAAASGKPTFKAEATVEAPAVEKTVERTVARRGRPAKTRTVAATTTTATVRRARKPSKYGFYLSRSEYTLDQVQELGALAVTTNGRTYRLACTEDGVIKSDAVRVG